VAGAILFLWWAVPPRPQYRRIVGEAIRAYRKRAGLTQEKLAEKADLHHNFVGELERGNMETSLGSMVKIAKALNVRVRDLVKDL
jgi:XRE family transcriptional regulator, regulator of sulfur utilization